MSKSLKCENSAAHLHVFAQHSMTRLVPFLVCRFTLCCSCHVLLLDHEFSKKHMAAANSVKRQTRKGAKRVIECDVNTCKPLQKLLKMLVKFECEHMKA